MPNEMDRSYAKLLSALRRAKADDYNDQDVKFVRMMIPHHEAAVEMAEKQIKDGENAEIVDLAKAVKKAQNEEIDGMRKWLKDRDLDEDDGGNGGKKKKHEGM